MIGAAHATLDALLRAAYATAPRTRPLQRYLRTAMSLPRWRLLAALSVAGAAHAAIIGLVRFDTGHATATPPMIAVTRLISPSVDAPLHADHVAAADQRDGHGTAQRSRVAGRPIPAHIAPAPATPPVRAAALRDAAAGIATAPPVVRIGIAAPDGSGRHTAIAGRRTPAPTAGLAAREAARAAYLATWRGIVEREGTLHFPLRAAADARERSLILQLTLRADGSIAAARIARSSGSDNLDHAALAILHRAAPFPPLPAALRAPGRALTFAYQWHFLPSAQTASLSAP